MLASVLVILVGCLCATTALPPPPYWMMPRPMASYAGPSMQPTGAVMPMYSQQPSFYRPTPQNYPPQFNPRPMGPMFSENTYENRMPVEFEEQDFNSDRMPMRAKFEKWLDVVDDLKQSRATDEEYAKAFKDFVRKEQTQTANIPVARARKLNNNEQSPVAEKEPTLAIETKTKEAKEDPVAVLAEFLGVHVPKPVSEDVAKTEPQLAEIKNEIPVTKNDEEDEYYDDDDEDEEEDTTVAPTAQTETKETPQLWGVKTETSIKTPESIPVEEEKTPLEITPEDQKIQTTRLVPETINDEDEQDQEDGSRQIGETQEEAKVEKLSLRRHNHHHSKGNKYYRRLE